MSEELKKWIKEASYKQLLARNRFGSMGDPMFQGDLGDYFIKHLKLKKDELTVYEQVLISKQIGWD